jgi:hypothetical protein
MPVHLEITEGPAKGRQIPLTIGRTLSVGRSGEKSMLALPEDAHLSGQHFTVGLRNGQVLLNNLSKVNPTEVNGQQIHSAVLKPGESFKAGTNTFSVVGGENPHPAAFRVGGWGFPAIPEGWEPQPGKGLSHSQSEPFRANIIVAEETLPEGYDLAKYVALQVSLGQKHLKEASFSAANPAQVTGADQAMAIAIQAHAEKGPAVQYQVYAVHAGIVGIITATALASQAELLREVFGQLLPGLTFFQA